MNGETGLTAAESQESPPEIEEPFPWPRRPHDDFISAAARLWVEILLRPAALFRRLPEGRRAAPAITFYLAVGTLAAGAALFWEAMLGPWSFLGLRETAGVGLDALGEFLLAPLSLLLGLYIAAAVTHAILRIVGGANRAFSTTRDVFAYAWAPQLLAVIPRIGTIVGAIWMVRAAIIGLREAHRTDGWRAGVAVLLPLTLLIAMVGIAVLFAVATGTLQR